MGPEAWGSFSCKRKMSVNLEGAQEEDFFLQCFSLLTPPQILALLHLSFIYKVNEADMKRFLQNDVSS